MKSGEKENGMEVRLKQEWHGYPVGAIVKVNNVCANDLFQRDTAEKMESESNVSIKENIQRLMANKVKTSNK